MFFEFLYSFKIGCLHMLQMLKVLPEKSFSSKKVEKQNSELSLEEFVQEYFEPGSPVVISDCMSHWPAISKWNDIDYLKTVAGDRTVPVEVVKFSRHFEAPCVDLFLN